MFDLSKIAFVSALTLVTALATAVNEFTKAFDFAPFWSDVLLLMGTLAVATYLFAESSKYRVVVVSQSSIRKFVRFVGAYMLPSFVACLALVNAVRPLESLSSGSWTACGTIASRCNTPGSPPSCVKLYDDRGRQTVRECFPLDSSGYFQTPVEPRWNYKPRNISLSCGAVEAPAAAMSAELLNNPACDGSVRLP
jgi:hypothetical protein